MPPTATPIVAAAGGNLSPATPGLTLAAAGGNLAPDGPFGAAPLGTINLVISGVSTAGVNGTLVPSGMANGMVVWTSDGVWPRPSGGSLTYTYALYNGVLWHVGRKTEGASPTVYYLALSGVSNAPNPVGLTFTVSTGSGAATVSLPGTAATATAAVAGGNLAPATPGLTQAAAGGNLAPATPGGTTATGGADLSPTPATGGTRYGYADGLPPCLVITGALYAGPGAVGPVVFPKLFRGSDWQLGSNSLQKNWTSDGENAIPATGDYYTCVILHSSTIHRQIIAKYTDGVLVASWRNNAVPAGNYNPLTNALTGVNDANGTPTVARATESSGTAAAAGGNLAPAAPGAIG